MTDDFADAIEAVHGRLGPGPSLEGARVPVARRSLLRITHVIREYQQQVDLAMLRLIERQRADHDDLRREGNVTRQSVADVHARVDELEARIVLLTALTDDLLMVIDRLQREQTIIELPDDGVVAQIARRAVAARDGVIDATG